MSYIVQVWEQPPGWKLPDSIEEGLHLIERLRDEPAWSSGRFESLGKVLGERYPGIGDDDGGGDCVWIDGSVEGGSDEPVWNIGIVTGDRLEEVQAVVAAEANALGLNMMDEQAGEMHLADGRVFSLGPRGPCVKGLAALWTGDHAKALQEFRRLAAEGNPTARRQLGVMYFEGKGVRQNTVAACALLTGVSPHDAEKVRQRIGPAASASADRLLSEMGRPEGLLAALDAFCAREHERFLAAKERGRTDDYAAVLVDIVPLAEQGHEEAQLMLALMHAEGLGLPPDAHKAALWTRRSARGGCRMAQFNLACMYEKGDIFPRDLKQAKHWYGSAALAGDWDAIAALKRLAAPPEPPREEKLATFMPRAEAGDAEAQFQVGDLHYLNPPDGSPRNPAEAAHWYALAARQGHAQARFTLGCMHKQGDGVVQDDAQAVHWFQLAAEQGLAEAQYNLAVSHLRGEGTTRDALKACTWLSQAAAQSHADAMYLLASMHRQGTGVSPDPIVAQALFLLAKEKGCTRPFDNVFREGEAAQVNVLLQQISATGLLDALAARRRRLAAPASSAAPPERASRRDAAAEPATRSAQRHTTEPAHDEPAPNRWHAGHLALVLSMLSLPVLLMLPHPGALLARTFAVAGLLLGAYGVVRVGRDLGHGQGLIILSVVGALIPGVSTLVCLAMLLAASRRR